MNGETQFWVVWNPAGHSPTVRHESIHQAKAEAERLARSNPHNKFYVLGAVAVCQRNDVAWETLGDADADADIPL